MPGINLTRAEASQRSATVTAQSYEVSLDLSQAGDTSQPTYRSETVARFDADPGATTWLDLIAPAVHSVRVNGQDLDPSQVFDGSRITLTDLQSSNEVVVVADAAFMTTGEGLHRFTDPADGEVYLYSQFEVADARRVFACFDQPDLKARFTFTVDAPVHWTVVSNSPAGAIEANESSTSRRWQFDPTPPISTYITAVCAGLYHEVRDEHSGTAGTIGLGLYCRQSLVDHLDSDELFTITRQGFAFYEEAFGHPYPFAKYDQVFVPEFNAGAMENAGCVTYRDEYLFRSRVTDAAYERRAETMLHEMAHMWFGDLVTMRWWDDLWLNESFATWASVLCQAEATRWTDSWTTFATTEKLWALRQDQLPTTHPISADARDLEDVENNFDGITYAKGASVLKQLVAYVGREEFFAGLRRYFRDNAWGNTTMSDLFKELEAESGRDLGAWEAEWLTTAGVVALTPQITTTDLTGPTSTRTYSSVTVAQEATEEHPTLRSHRIGIGLYDITDGGLTRRDHLRVDIQGDRTEVPDLAGVPAADLLLLNDDDLTFAKVRFDDASMRTVISSIADFSESLPRAMCWTAATDMLRDAQLPARRYVDLVLAGSESADLGVLQTVLRTGHAAVLQYCDPDYRPILARTWAEGLADLAESAEAGSDRQLALARAWVAAAPLSSADRLKALLDGSDSLPGLVVDADLRWHLIERLAALGVADEAAIAAEEATDTTAAGQRHAAHARASRPSAAAKAEAWEALVAVDRLSNAMGEATLAGFVQPEQADLLAPYTEKYFAMVEQAWRTQTPRTAERLVDGLFPRYAVSQDVIDRAEEWLSEHPHLHAMRRLVLEGAADTRRALRAQQADRAAG